MIIVQLVFWFLILLLAQSYLLFPLFLRLTRHKKRESNAFFTEDELPAVAILMSVHNEEKIIGEKILSLVNTRYPTDRIRIEIGSDASDDRTNEIMLGLAGKYPNLHPRIFTERQGKPGVINQLVASAKEEILVLTDAKVLFTPDTLHQLIRHFKQPGIGIVGAHIINTTVSSDGISVQEKAFMSREMLIKKREGEIWGATVGVYGAAYAIRRSLFTPVPDGYATDDFFITMGVIGKGYESILDLEAVTYEEVPNQISEEYRRKVRIATGNFQNLWYFKRIWLNLFSGAGFAFFSHKVIRWSGPFILGGLLILNLFLYPLSLLYRISLWTQLILLIIPIIDFYLVKIGIHIVFLRFVSHFYSMNVALFNGFLNYIRGRRAHVWKPTNR